MMLMTIVWFYILALKHDSRLNHMFLPYLREVYFCKMLYNKKFFENRLHIQCQGLTEC